MHHVTFRVPDLTYRVIENGFDVCFSRVLFNTIAPVIGLNPDAKLGDAKRFDLGRARITNDLFSKIVDDVHVAINIFGLPREHTNTQSLSGNMLSVRYLVPPVLLEFAEQCRSSHALFRNLTS